MDKEYEKITITIPKDVMKEFRNFCARHAINMSGRISKLIEKDLEINQGENNKIRT